MDFFGTGFSAGKRIAMHMKYGTQISTSPPVIRIFCNRPKGMRTAYLRYLERELCDGDRVDIYRPLPKKPRDAHATDDKKERIRARKEQCAAGGKPAS
ncbi:MAG: hypothetical protein R8K53_01990 [Mariprofundaceae bacterium]